MLRERRLVLLLFSLAGVLVVASFGIALAATTTTFYLKGSGVPVAPLSEIAPSAGTLPNHDPGRDDAPGLLLHKGGGEQETDPAKHQMWLAAEGELLLDGAATFTFWSAMKDFDTDKKGRVKVFLLDCNPSGTDCLKIASAARGANPWNSETGWVARTVDFGTVGHTIAADRSLAVKLVVTNQSHDDMWFAYDTVSYTSALVVQATSPPPTTTTTTTTTTTNPPPTTTTTTPPPTTTTTTITSPVAETTTTTIAVVVTEEVPPTTSAPDDSLPEEDAALSPLPDDDGDESQGGLTSGLLDSLELAIPPAVASSLLSPLLLLESILGAFFATGRGLLIPGLLLVVGILAAEGRRRRDVSLMLPDRVEAQP
jgi:hypothetical protein